MLEQIDLEKVADIAREAGKAVMEIYQRDFEVEFKADESPLTEADTRANEIICRRLEELYSGVPMLSEENKEIPYETRKGWKEYWCIDPIDGTKEFIKKNGEFTINIALVHDGEPVLGVVYAPALDDLYTAKRGEGAWKNRQRLPLQKNNAPQKSLRVVASKSHLSPETQEFIDALRAHTEEIEQVSKGSSLKLVMVAEGSADIYPRLAPTMEWDTAAADAIVREAGKMSYRYEEGVDYLNASAQELDALKLPYNKENLLNPWFVVV